MEDVTLDELRALLAGEGVALLDVRSPLEFDGAAGAHCDPRHGHIPGAVNLPLERILECRSAVEVRDLVGLPEGTDDRGVLPRGESLRASPPKCSRAPATARGTTSARGTSGRAPCRT